MVLSPHLRLIYLGAWGDFEAYRQTRIDEHIPEMRNKTSEPFAQVCCTILLTLGSFTLFDVQLRIPSLCEHLCTIREYHLTFALK